MDEDGSFMDFPAEFSCLGKVSQIEPSFYDLIRAKNRSSKFVEKLWNFLGCSTTHDSSCGRYNRMLCRAR